jgi:hypothetical protein
VMRTRRSGCAYGNGRTNKAFTRLNIAAFPPMPRAIEKMQSPVNTGVRPYARNACRRSCRRCSHFIKLHMSRHSSVAIVMLPICLRVSSAADSGSIPARTFSARFCSK